MSTIKVVSATRPEEVAVRAWMAVVDGDTIEFMWGNETQHLFSIIGTVKDYEGLLINAKAVASLNRVAEERKIKFREMEKADGKVTSIQV